MKKIPTVTKTFFGVSKRCFFFTDPPADPRTCHVPIHCRSNQKFFPADPPADPKFFEIPADPPTDPLIFHTDPPADPKIIFYSCRSTYRSKNFFSCRSTCRSTQGQMTWIGGSVKKNTGMGCKIIFPSGLHRGANFFLRASRAS